VEEQNINYVIVKRTYETIFYYFQPFPLKGRAVNPPPSPGAINSFLVLVVV
jgi:hypothetical protein